MSEDIQGTNALPIRKADSTFHVGVDRSGNWVVQSEDGRCGGLFVGRKEAIRFALSQNGKHHEHILLVDSSLELDLKPAGVEACSTAATKERFSDPSLRPAGA